MECSAACFVDRRGNCHAQVMPLIGRGPTYDEIASRNNYVWTFESRVTVFVI